MPEYLSPGVYVEEVPSKSTIEGVSTTVTGFIGPTRYGPIVGDPELLTSYLDFSRYYGGVDQINFADAGAQDNYMAHAVRTFFDNGGTMLYVTRVYGAPPTDGGTPNPNAGKASLPVGGSVPMATLRARFPGAAGNMQIVFAIRTSPNVLVSTTLGQRSARPQPVRPRLHQAGHERRRPRRALRRGDHRRRCWHPAVAGRHDGQFLDARRVGDAGAPHSADSPGRARRDVRDAGKLERPGAQSAGAQFRHLGVRRHPAVARPAADRTVRDRHRIIELQRRRPDPVAVRADLYPEHAIAEPRYQHRTAAGLDPRLIAAPDAPDPGTVADHLHAGWRQRRQSADADRLCRPGGFARPRRQFHAGDGPGNLLRHRRNLHRRGAGFHLRLQRRPERTELLGARRSRSHRP